MAERRVRTGLADMRKVLLFESVDAGVFVCVSRAGDGDEVMAGLRMLEGKVDRTVGCAIDSERRCTREAGCGESPGGQGLPLFRLLECLMELGVG
jgi:hypothetical protein